MDGLDDRARRILDRVARVDEPPADRLAAIEARLHERIAAGDPGSLPDASSGITAGAKLTLVLGGIATVVTGAVAIWMLMEPQQPRSPAEQDVVAVRDEHASEPAELPARQAMPEDTSDDEPLAEAARAKEPIGPLVDGEGDKAKEIATPGDDESDADAVSKAEPGPRRRAERVESDQGEAAASPPALAPQSGSVPDDPVPAPDEDALAAELRLMRHAMGALREQRWDDALRAFGRHAERFPDGVLQEERDVGRIEALCGSGQIEEGLRHVDAFVRAHRDSPLRGRARRACEK